MPKQYGSIMNFVWVCMY